MAKKVIKKEEVKDFSFEGLKEVVFVSNGKSPYLKKGTEHTISVEMAKIFLSQELGTIK